MHMCGSIKITYKNVLTAVGSKMNDAHVSFNLKINVGMLKTKRQRLKKRYSKPQTDKDRKLLRGTD